MLHGFDPFKVSEFLSKDFCPAWWCQQANCDWTLGGFFSVETITLPRCALWFTEAETALAFWKPTISAGILVFEDGFLGHQLLRHLLSGTPSSESCVENPSCVQQRHTIALLFSGWVHDNKREIRYLDILHVPFHKGIPSIEFNNEG